MSRNQLTGIGCYYVMLSYLFYWPALWAMRTGSVWHVSRHPEFACDWGEPGFWVLAWILAPLVTPIHLLGAVTYWVLGPMVDCLVAVLW